MSPSPEAYRAPLTSARASLREIERRRSERLLLTVPIMVEGVDKNGEKFCEETRTIVINRLGARIYLRRAINAGVTLIVTSMVGRRKGANFRVVGPTQPPTGEGGEWGLECLEENSNVWGIGFPPPQYEEGICTALIECRRCHTVRLSYLSMVEHEVLGTSGLLVKPCDSCARSTPWSYSETSVATPLNDAGTAAANADGTRPAAQQRAYHRVALQLPIRMRNYYGIEEFARSENVSRGGLCFISEKAYEVGEVLLVTCPYEKGGHNIEVRGQVVSRRDMQGTARKIYGVSYERT
jgi:hypothetical protein